jgi:hypothetical protein
MNEITVTLVVFGVLALAFVVGCLIGGSVEDRPQPSALRARDIYATVNMPTGEFASGPPSRVDIDGAMTTYHFPFKNVGFSGEITKVGLHMNGLVTECKVNPPVTVGRGDNLTIVQPVGMESLTAANPPDVTP